MGPSPGALGELGSRGTGLSLCRSLSLAVEVSPHVPRAAGQDVPPNSSSSHPLRAPLGRGGWKPPGGEATSREEAPSPRAGLQGEEAG